MVRPSAPGRTPGAFGVGDGSGGLPKPDQVALGVGEVAGEAHVSDGHPLVDDGATGVLDLRQRVIDVDSIDDAFKKVVAAGGTVINEKMAVGEMGFAGYFTDTEGNLIGLWETA